MTGQDLREFKNQVNDIDLVAKNTAQLYLWTKRGASRHCKILDTEKAWEQFDCLEENYFNNQQVHTIMHQYPISPVAMESATNAGRLFERIMRRESAAPHEIAYTVKHLFNQAGINVPDCVVKIPAYEQNGQLLTDSREVAAMVEKNHKELLKKYVLMESILLRAILRSVIFSLNLNFRTAQEENSHAISAQKKVVI